jgi:hypothetical protein
MAKRHQVDIYGVDRFSLNQLATLHRSVQEYAEGIGGLPRLHSETFAKRGWLLPFLFAYDDLLWGSMAPQPTQRI